VHDVVSPLIVVGAKEEPSRGFGDERGLRTSVRKIDLKARLAMTNTLIRTATAAWMTQGALQDQVEFRCTVP
jgi:hypothetical protein